MVRYHIESLVAGGVDTTLFSHISIVKHEKEELNARGVRHKKYKVPTYTLISQLR